MSKSSYIDPDLIPGLERLAQAGAGFDLSKDLDSARRASQARDDALISQLQVPDTIVQEIIPVTSAGGHIIDLRIFRPLNAPHPLPVFYWIHGGGFVLGAARQGDAFTLRAAAALGMYAVSVEYRLAPETPYPGPLEDCYEGLAHLIDNADALNVDAEKIIIGGVSAGGGLCAGLGLLVRDRMDVSLLGQILLYPMLDDTNIAAAAPTLPDTLVWTRAANLFGWQSYLGDQGMQRFMRHRRGPTTLPAYRQLICRSAISICFLTKTWPMRASLCRPAFRRIFMSSQAPITDLTDSQPKLRYRWPAMLKYSTSPPNVSGKLNYQSLSISAF